MPRLNCWNHVTRIDFSCALFIYTCYSQSLLPRPPVSYTRTMWKVEERRRREKERDVNCCCCFAHSNFIDIHIQCRVHTTHTHNSILSLIISIPLFMHVLCVLYTFCWFHCECVCTPPFYTIAHISKTANEVKQKTKQSTQRLPC